MRRDKLGCLAVISIAPLGNSAMSLLSSFLDVFHPAGPAWSPADPLVSRLVPPVAVLWACSAVLLAFAPRPGERRPRVAPVALGAALADTGVACLLAAVLPLTTGTGQSMAKLAAAAVAVALPLLLARRWNDLVERLPWLARHAFLSAPARPAEPEEPRSRGWTAAAGARLRAFLGQLMPPLTAALPPFPRPGQPPLPGQVWEVRYPFDDTPDGKLRPALLIHCGAQGVTALKITGQDKLAHPEYVAVFSDGWSAMRRRQHSCLDYRNARFIPWPDVHRPLGLCDPPEVWDRVARFHGITPRQASAA